MLTGNEKTILDFGCGVGRFSAPLAKISNCKVIAVDPIEHLIKMAPKDDNVEYQVIQEGILPLDDASIDVIWVCLVLGSITNTEDLKQTVSEI